ncbi:MAG: hypothetical protein ILA34_00565 [Bacteroidaceae bacterium]|nr:hypothetical protein [Bacteroidaceae bacterium]
MNKLFFFLALIGIFLLHSCNEKDHDTILCDRFLYVFNDEDLEQHLCTGDSVVITSIRPFEVWYMTAFMTNEGVKQVNYFNEKAKEELNIHYPLFPSKEAMPELTGEQTARLQWLCIQHPTDSTLILMADNESDKRDIIIIETMPFKSAKEKGGLRFKASIKCHFEDNGSI